MHSSSFPNFYSAPNWPADGRSGPHEPQELQEPHRLPPPSSSGTSDEGHINIGELTTQQNNFNFPVPRPTFHNPPLDLLDGRSASSSHPSNNLTAIPNFVEGPDISPARACDDAVASNIGDGDGKTYGCSELEALFAEFSAYQRDASRLLHGCDGHGDYGNSIDHYDNISSSGNIPNNIPTPSTIPFGHTPPVQPVIRKRPYSSLYGWNGEGDEQAVVHQTKHSVPHSDGAVNGIFGVPHGLTTQSAMSANTSQQVWEPSPEAGPSTGVSKYVDPHQEWKSQEPKKTRRSNKNLEEPSPVLNHCRRESAPRELRKAEEKRAKNPGQYIQCEKCTQWLKLSSARHHFAPKIKCTFCSKVLSRADGANRHKSETCPVVEVYVSALARVMMDASLRQPPITEEQWKDLVAKIDRKEDQRAFLNPVASHAGTSRAVNSLIKGKLFYYVRNKNAPQGSPESPPDRIRLFEGLRKLVAGSGTKFTWPFFQRVRATLTAPIRSFPHIQSLSRAEVIRSPDSGTETPGLSFTPTTSATESPSILSPSPAFLSAGETRVQSEHSSPLPSNSVAQDQALLQSRNVILALRNTQILGQRKVTSNMLKAALYSTTDAASQQDQYLATPLASVFPPLSTLSTHAHPSQDATPSNQAGPLSYVFGYNKDYQFKFLSQTQPNSIIRKP